MISSRAVHEKRSVKCDAVLSLRVPQRSYLILYLQWHYSIQGQTQIAKYRNLQRIIGLGFYTATLTDILRAPHPWRQFKLCQIGFILRVLALVRET